MPVSIKALIGHRSESRVVQIDPLQGRRLKRGLSHRRLSWGRRLQTQQNETLAGYDSGRALAWASFKPSS